jgi:hypothetical protein
MSKITDISFGSDVKFTSQEVEVGSDFFKKESINAGKLGTELYKGEFSVTDKVNDNFPVFNAFGSKESSSNTTASSPPTPPSTRPYVWKYQ